MMSHRCGRLDPHDEHDWTSPARHEPGYIGTMRPARTYTCTGAPIIEGGYVAEWDAADDLAEDKLRARDYEAWADL